MKLILKLKLYVITGLIALSSMLLPAGCTDVLNIAPDGNLTMEEILSDPTHVEGLLNGCYRSIIRRGVWYWFWDQILIACSDDAWCSEDGMGQPIDMYYSGSGSAAWHPFNDWPNWPDQTEYPNQYRYWELYWPQIRLCTQFINVIDEATVRRESDRGRFRAEAHVLRAYFYLELVKWYGSVPIMRELWPIDMDFSELPRDPVYDVAKFIAEDCDVAINTPDSEFPWRIEVPSEAMRVTKALAHSLKSQAMVFAASPLHNKGQDHWEETYQICKKAVEELKAHGYELHSACTNPDKYGTYPAAAYHQLFCENVDYSAAPRDRETIWAHKEGGHFGWHIAYIGKPMSNAYKAGTCPTQELMDAYETVDGEPVLDLAQPYLDERHLQPNYNAKNKMYDRNNPHQNRDPRMNATTMQNGSKFRWSQGVEYTVEAYFGADGVPDGMHFPTLVKSDRARSRTGYFMRKLVPPGASDTNQEPTAHTKFHRLGELLMDYAEAALEAGHLAEAKAAADETRARVGMPPLPDGLSKDDLRLRIRNERRIELAWEENRYYDLRRWQKPDGDLSATCKYLTGMWITKHPNGSFTYERVNIQDNPRGGWQNKDLFLPIPLSDVSRIGDPDWQNPGW